MAFIPHESGGSLGSYISISIGFPPVKELFVSLQDREEMKLKNRGEAHITVITPIEFSQVLKEKISIKELNQLVLKENLQASKFEVICLGMGKKIINFKEERTFYLVVTSEDLLEYRRRVEKLFIQRGGRKGKFDAEHFYPHITVGFSKRDLHEQDGVIKGMNSCYAGLNMIL